MVHFKKPLFFKFPKRIRQTFDPHSTSSLKHLLFQLPLSVATKHRFRATGYRKFKVAIKDLVFHNSNIHLTKIRLKIKLAVYYLLWMKAL